MKNNVCRAFLVSILLIAGSHSSGQAQPLIQNERLRERIQQRFQETGVESEIKDAILSGIAFYPDEVVAAIFEVAQEPQHLMAGTRSENPAFNRAYQFLSGSPEVISNLKAHPIATRIVGHAAATDIQKAWAEIDAIRARYAETTGTPVAEAVVSETLPPAVVIPLADNAEVGGATQTTEEVMVVNWDPTATYIVEEEGEEVVYAPYPYPAGTVYVGENVYYRTQGGTVVASGENGAVAAGGGAVVTENGVVAGGGYAAVNSDEGTFQSGATVGGVNSQGEGFIAHREGDGSWDENSFERSGEGQVQTTTGQGAEWETSRSGERTEDGFTSQTSKSLETNNGASVESDRSVEYGSEGLDVDRSGSATDGNGQSYEWGNSDSSSQKNAGASSASEKSAQNARASAQGTGAQNRTANRARLGASPQMNANRSGWDFFQGQNPGQAASKFARSGQAALSPQTWSGKNLDAQKLNTAMQRGNLQQGRTFGSLDKSNKALPSSMKRPGPKPLTASNPNSSAARSRDGVSRSKSGLSTPQSRDARSYKQGGGASSLRGGGGRGRR
jgi:hypothetical protein